MTLRTLALLVVALGGCDRVFNLQEPTPDAPDAPPPPERWEQVSGGLFHACGIRLDHSLWCWGRNDSGQLGQVAVGADLEADEPIQVGSDQDWTEVSTGAYTTCAIRAEGQLWCWGYNGQGQLGDGLPSEPPHPMMSHVPGTWSAVSVGTYHGCAIAATGALWCWGQPMEGQLGDDLADLSAVVRPVSSTLRWKTVSVGDGHSCALASDDTAWCWGRNLYGQLGIGNYISQGVPQRVGTGTWKQIAAGSNHTCGLEPEGRLRCWGANTNGEIGDGGTGVANQPTPVGQDEITDWATVSTGAYHTCAQRTTGQIYCWGSNHRGQLVSDVTRVQRVLPTPIAMENRWTSIALGQGHTCLIDDQAQLWCAGDASAGALGVAGEGSRRQPVRIERSWKSVSTANQTTCGITMANELACWGNGSSGEIGVGTRDAQQTPTVVAGTWSEVSTGGHTCGIQAPTGAGYCGVRIWMGGSATAAMSRH